MEIKVKDFGNDENRHLVPGFFIRTNGFHQFSSKVEQLAAIDATNEEEEVQQTFLLHELITESVNLFLNIIMNCVEDYDSLDSDLMARFAYKRSDENYQKIKDTMISLKAMMEVYQFAVKVMMVLDYCFLIGGKVWAEKAIKFINENNKNEDVKKAMTNILNDPNFEVKAFMTDKNGSIEISRQDLMKVLGIDTNDDNDPFDLMNMPTIGEA